MKKKYTKKNLYSRTQIRQNARIALISLVTITAFSVIAIIADKPNEYTEDITCTMYAEPVSTTLTTNIQSVTTHVQTSAVTSTQNSTTVLSTSALTQTTVTQTSCTSATSINVQRELDTTTQEIISTAVIMTSTTDSTESIEADVVSYDNTELQVTDAERTMLYNLVAHEYGSDWVPVYEKAKVAAVAMNRLRNGYWGSTLYDVLTYPGQFTGFSSYGIGGCTSQVTESVIEAVDYYLAHPDEFDNWLYFDGDHYVEDGSGPYNYFYY